MKTFEIKEEHLKLLSRVYVDWDDCEYGAPAINGKRPYGNSDVEDDIAEILGWEYDREEGLDRKQCKKARTLHKETQTVLQIILSTQSFKTGVYENYEEYNETKWRLRIKK